MHREPPAPSAPEWLTELEAIPGKQRLHAHQIGACGQGLTQPSGKSGFKALSQIGAGPKCERLVDGYTVLLVRRLTRQ